MEDRTRVVVATSQPILGSIVRGALTADPALEIVAEASDLNGLRLVLQEKLVDVAVVDVGQSDPASICVDVLEAHPRLRMLILGDNGRIASACQMQVQHRPLGQLSPADLLEAVRALVGAR